MTKGYKFGSLITLAFFLQTLLCSFLSFIYLFVGSFVFIVSLLLNDVSFHSLFRM